MSRKVFADMVEYYTHLADQLTSEARQAKVLENPSAIGTDREEIYLKFLKRHIPYTCEVFRGGYLFDTDGNASKQIDLIITAGSSPRFEMRDGSQANASIEGTIGAVEVKSNLDKVKLHEALENFAEIPSIGNPEESLSPLLKFKDSTWWWNWPYKVIFAYNGIDKELLCEYLREFYDGRPDIPNECRPSMIHVLGSYLILRMTRDLKTMNTDGSRVEPQPDEGQYDWFNEKPDISAMSILFTQLHRNAIIANHMIWDYSKWANNIAYAVLESLED